MWNVKMELTCQMPRPRWHQCSWTFWPTGPSRSPCHWHSNSCWFSCFLNTWGMRASLCLNRVWPSVTPTGTDARPHPHDEDWPFLIIRLKAEWQDARLEGAISSSPGPTWHENLGGLRIHWCPSVWLFVCLSDMRISLYFKYICHVFNHVFE